MKINKGLSLATKRLEANSIATARLDALVLLEDVTGVNRARLLAEPELELTAVQEARLEKLLKRRAGHEPLAYIRGKTEFYGREFIVTPAVLEPRPESEMMIDILKELAERHSFSQIADVGAGSGALGITARLELLDMTKLSIDLLEIDPAAAAVARLNVDKYTIGISVIESDLLNQSNQDYDMLLCNLPYVPDDYVINRAAGHEPQLAILGGPDGLAIYRRLFQQIAALTIKPLYILTESLPLQHTELQTIAEQHDYKLSRTEDFIQLFKRRS